MLFRRKKKARPVKKPRVTADDVIVGAAKTIGAAIGTASGAVEIGKQSAAEARNIDTDALKKTALEKKELVAKKATETGGRAARQAGTARKAAEAKAQDTKEKAEEAKKLAAQKAEEAKKLASAKAAEARQAAGEKMDEMREAAAEKIAPKKKRGLLRRIRG